MKITVTPYFYETRACWRVRLRGADLDTRLNVPDDEFDRERVACDSTSKRAENIAFTLMKNRNPENVSEATWERNEIHFRNLKRLPRKLPLKDIRPDLIDRETAARYRDERSAEGAKGRTIQGELAFLKQLLRFGFEDAATVTGAASASRRCRRSISMTRKDGRIDGGSVFRRPRSYAASHAARR